MRLLMTTDTVGGVWTFTSELTRQLLQRGHAVHLVSFGRQPSPAQLSLQHCLKSTYPDLFGYTSSDLPLEWMQNNEDVHAEGEKLLLHLLQHTSFDLILSNQFCFGRLQTTVPRIVVAHSDVLSWARACDPSVLAGSPWLNRYVAMVQGGLMDAAAVIVPSAFMGKALKTSFFLPRNYLVIPNGLTLPSPAEPAPERKLQAITAGRLWDQAKGLETLQDLGSPMPLLVAGDNYLDSPNQSFTWPADLINLGQLTPTDLHQRFRESAIYLCTSLYEPFGLAPLEAALCGCAVVARDLPSLREVWEDNALYFTDNTSLSRTLHALSNDPSLLAEAQRRALHRAQHFTSDRMAGSYLHLFQNVLQQQRAAPHVS